jgi:hypothetical protein
MTLWIIAFITAFFSVPNFSTIYWKLRSHFFQSKALADLKLSIAHLRLIKESLESGLVPAREDWNRVAELPKPWGELFSASLSELRNQGAPILPSLERMILSLEEERELTLEAKTKSSQAFGQVMISVFLVPFFGLVLYALLPGLEHFKGPFISLVCFCILLGVLAFFWMLQMMEDARFGKVSRAHRTWILSSKIFFERMIADVSGGHPPDLAWGRSIEFLHQQEPELLQNWGVQIWEDISQKNTSMGNPVEESIVHFGVEIRRTIQQSLTEGRGCLDRLDSIYRNYLFDLKMKISRELQVLPNHCLKPLFILVLPAVMLLLFGSMALSFGEMIQ